MSKVRILLRWCALITAALVLLTCGSANSGGGDKRLMNPCSKGMGDTNADRPIVCVDDTGATLSVNPDPVIAHDVGKADRQPVMIQWWARSGAGELGINVHPGCVTDVTCRGGHCTARTLPTDAAGAHCKYDVWIGEKRLDPEIGIEDCCAP